MKTLTIPVLSALILSACATLGDQAYSGESTTFGSNNILRNDVTEVIARYEQAAFNCRNIQSVHSTITDTGSTNGRIHAQETWLVQACGVQHRYTVILSQDARGETDFFVGLDNNAKN